MAIETALHVNLANRPGEFAKVTRELANAGVNVRSVAGLTAKDVGALEFLVDDLDKAKQALRHGGTDFKEVRVVVSPIPPEVIDQPGGLARLAEALAAAEINVESLYAAVGPGGQLLGVLGCTDPEKAEPILASWGA